MSRELWTPSRSIVPPRWREPLIVPDRGVRLPRLPRPDLPPFWPWSFAFPIVQSASYSEETVDTATHDVVIPTGVANGDLLLLFMALDATPTISGMPSGWTQLKRVTSGTNFVYEIWRKSADGAEVNFTYTSSTSELSANRCLRISGWQGTPEASTGASGSSTTPDPDSLTPSWGADDTLWVAYYVGGHGARTASAYPTNYADNQYTDGTAGAATGVSIGICSRNLNAATEDPGTFTITTIDWLAVTVAVRAAAAAAGFPESLLRRDVGAYLRM